MKSIKRMALGAMVALMMMTSCGTTQTVPLTGRTHRISVSDEQVLSLSNKEYTKYMATAKKSTNAQHTAMVQRVGRKLATAVETYLKQNGFANDVKNYAWEFNLVQDKSANAFCMPGGKIVVYEGFCPIHRMRRLLLSSWDMKLLMLWQSTVPSSLPSSKTNR